MITTTTTTTTTRIAFASSYSAGYDHGCSDGRSDSHPYLDTLVYKQMVYDVNNMTEDIMTKMKNYDIKAVPTTIIDGKIRIVGIPDFPWICGGVIQ